MFLKSVLAGAAVVVGLVGLAPAAFAGYHETVQLNSGATANVYQSTAPNKVFGACETVDPKVFSPVLEFGELHEEVVPGTPFDLWATVTLKPGVGPGTYRVTMNCGNSYIGADFTVPGPSTTTPPTKDPSLPSVWLNDTAATTGVYQYGKQNTAFGDCPDGRGVFDSPVLTFGAPNYGYGNAGHGSANVSANATLKSGVGPGRYVLVMNCDDKQARVDFTVPAKQVTKTPVGAPQTGGGGTATLFE